MIRSSLFLILILAGSAFAQGPAFIISWAAVEQRVDGTYIDEPIAYRIYEATTGAVLCATPTTECIVQGQRGQCSTAYVTAILIESGMESVPSNSVSGCIGDGDGDDPVTELDLSPPVAPEAEMTTTEGDGEQADWGNWSNWGNWGRWQR